LPRAFALSIVSGMRPILRAACLSSLLLFAGSALASAPLPYEARAASVKVYQLDAAEVRPALEDILSAEGYRWDPRAPSARRWRTYWHCRGDYCDRLTIALTPRAGGTSIAIVRTRREGATDSRIESSDLASDLEWSLFERLDPRGARRVAAASRAQGS
jgi:hypothetical protein